MIRAWRASEAGVGVCAEWVKENAAVWEGEIQVAGQVVSRQRETVPLPGVPVVQWSLVGGVWKPAVLRVYEIRPRRWLRRLLGAEKRTLRLEERTEVLELGAFEEGI